MKRRLLFAALLLTSAAQAAPLHPVFQVDPYWPRPLPHGYVFGSSGGVTVDSHDNVWIYSRPTSTHITMSNPPEAGNGRPAPSVVEISNDGRFLQGWGGVLAMSEEERSHFDWPVQEHGIAVDAHDNVWVCGNGRDAKTHRDDDQCLKFTNNGKFILQLGKSGKSKGSLDTENLGHPSQAVYYAPANELFVSDGYVNRRVYVADADTGKFKRMWGAYGNKPDDTPIPHYDVNSPQFGNPMHCAQPSNDGLIYACDRTNNRIQVFKMDGTYLRQIALKPETRGDGSAWEMAFSRDPQQ